MHQVIFSGFADEAAISLDGQMDVLEKNGVNYIEMRMVDGKHVLQHTTEELKALKVKLDAKGFKISAIGSPIGKTPITDDFSLEKERFMLAVNAAKILDCKYIRGFSFYTPKESEPEDFADEVINRLTELVKIAEENGLVYALENESGIFTNNLKRCEYVFGIIKSDSFKMAFDPGNFIRNDTEPYPAAYESLKEHIAYFHVKDAKQGDDHFVPSGEGDSNMDKLLSAAYNNGFSSFLSVEPHLKYIEDLNDAQRFTVAVNAMKASLNKAIGTNYEAVDIDLFK